MAEPTALTLDDIWRWGVIFPSRFWTPERILAGAGNVSPVRYNAQGQAMYDPVQLRIALGTDTYRDRHSRAGKTRSGAEREITCPQCGEIFTAAMVHVRFCQPECRASWHRDRRAKRERAKRQCEPVTILVPQSRPPVPA